LVAATSPFIDRLRASKRAAAFLDGVNAIALALMAEVTWQLARAALVNPLTIAIAALALLALFRTRVNSALLILAGGAVGVVVGR
jgi:chromate transporter